MCGITGILHFGRIPDAATRVERMRQSLRHRGPDDEGAWADTDVALGFRRLAIVDLETGRQPMTNEDASVWVVFNGEIYNHGDLRRQLQALGHRFATDHSDTEVLVHGYEHWGAALPNHLNGMFAFVVWNARTRRGLIACDRFGIKPLYYARAAASLVFGSEARAVKASGLVEFKPDATGVLEYFQQQNLWNGRTMFAGMNVVKPGTLIEFGPEGIEERRYWDVRFERRKQPMAEAAATLRTTVGDAIRRQIQADVPVTAYLSGGIDSSSIVAEAFRYNPKIKAYSCLFDLADVGTDRVVDEREFSRSVVDFLGIEHVELELPSNDLEHALYPTVAALEEPRMGMAYVNWRIAQRVAKDSKVVLSGCGGDEIFGGYVGRYSFLKDRLSLRSAIRTIAGDLRARRMPRPRFATDVRDPLFALYSFPITGAELPQALTPEFLRLAGTYSVRDGLEEILRDLPSDDPWDALMYVDAKTYLHGLLLVEDKLSMAHGLETRVPLLDNDVVDFALTCPWPILNDGATGKMVFRESIRDWVPATIADKPKMGFGPPDASWYRGKLRPFIQRVLAPDRIARRGVFQVPFVRDALEGHMSGKINRLPLIWSLLSFEAWCEVHDFYGGTLGAPVTRGVAK